MKRRYSEDEKNGILDLVQSGQWQIACKAAETIVNELRIQVVNANINNGSREITLRKAKYDGALQVLRYMNDIRAELKNG